MEHSAFGMDTQICKRLLVVALLLLARHVDVVEPFPITLKTSAQQQQKIQHQDIRRTKSHPTRVTRSDSHSTTALFASLSPERKRTLLTRKGPYFSLDRRAGTIAFGATAQLTTPLPAKDPALVTAWLNDAPSIAQSIWDPKLTTALGKNVYRLETTPLQFVMLQIAPSVDVEMKTILSQSSSQKDPIFTLQSIRFNPNIQSGLPGMPKIDADALGIVIETAGYLRQTTPSANDATCAVSGVISFQTSGSLPPPLRIVPEPVLQAAAETINQQIVQLAVRNFEDGAQANFRAFVQAQEPATTPSEEK